MNTLKKSIRTLKQVGQELETITAALPDRRRSLSREGIQRMLEDMLTEETDEQYAARTLTEKTVP